MSTVVADLEARLSFRSEGVSEAVSGFNTISKAQESLSNSVESSSAVYEELRFNVEKSIKTFREAAQSQKDIASAVSSTTYEKSIADVAELERAIKATKGEMANFNELLGYGIPEGDKMFVALEQAIGKTRAGLDVLLDSQQNQLAAAKEAASAFEEEGSAAEKVVRAHADLEQATNKLVSAQERLAASGQGMAGMNSFAQEAMADTTTLENAQAVLSRSVENTGASYRQLAQSTAEAMIQVIGIRNAIAESANAVVASGMSFDQVNAKMQSLTAGSIALGQEIAKLKTSFDLLGDESANAAIQDRIDSLTAEKQAIDEQLMSAQELSMAYETMAEGGGALIAAEAKLESQTIKLDKAQQDAAQSAQMMDEGAADMGSSLEQSSGQMRTASTRMNYYIQALASGNIGQTLIGQSASLAGQGIQKLTAALKSGGTAGEKMANVSGMLATSIKGLLTPTTLAIAAVAIAITVWQKWKKAQEEFQKAVYDTAKALGEQGQSIDEYSFSATKAMVTTKRLGETFATAGVGIYEFSEAMVDQAALDALTERLEGASRELSTFRQESTGNPIITEIFGSAASWGEVEASQTDVAASSGKVLAVLEEQHAEMQAGIIMAELYATAQEEWNQHLLETADYATLVGQRLVGPWKATQELTAALGDVNAMIKLLAGNDPEILKALEDLDATSIEELVKGLDMLADEYPQFTSMVSQLNGLLDAEAQKHRDAAAAIREQRDAAREAVDKGFAMTQSLSRLYDAQVAYENAPSGESAHALGEALKAATWAAQQLPEGMGPAIEYVALMESKGWLTAAAATELTARLFDTQVVAAELGGVMETTAVAVQTEGNAAAIATGQNDALAGSTRNVRSGLAGIIDIAYNAASALATYAGAANAAAGAGGVSGPRGPTGVSGGLPSYVTPRATGTDLSFINPSKNSGSLGKFANYKGGSGGSGGGGGGGGSSPTEDDKGLAIEEIKKFFQQVNKAIKAGVDGGVLYSDAGNAVPVGGPQDFIANEGGVNIQTINLRGVWDFADPAAKREIVRQLQEALAQFESEVS